MSRILEGKVAIVTGSGQGIGRAVAKYFASEGAKVVTNNRSAKPLGTGMLDEERIAHMPADLQKWIRDQYAGFAGDAETTAEQIREKGGEAFAYFCDVLDYDASKRLVDACVEKFGPPDILVNVAGSFGFAPIESMPKEMWYRVINAKVNGQYHMVHHTVPYMIEKKYGRILNCSSTAFAGSPVKNAEYCAANAASIGFTRALAFELKEHNIMVNAFTPFALTRASVDMEVFDKSTSDSDFNAMIGDAKPGVGYSDVPLADNFCPFLAYLSSDYAAGITGSVFDVEGNRFSLWADPEKVKYIDKDTPWTMEELIKAVPEQLLDGYISITDK